MTTSKKGLRASKISYSPFGITTSFQFTYHRQEMLDSEPGIASILRTNSDKRAQLRFSGNVKNSPAAKNGLLYLEVLVSLPQHSGRAGKEELSQQPPSAWIRKTALVIRRPRILTAVTSSVRAALCAVVTSR